MANQTAGFGHVHVHVGDIETALAFYREAFGAEKALRVGERLVFVRLSGDEIIGLDARPEPEDDRGHIGLRLAEGQDLDAAVEQVVRAGGALLGRGEHVPGVPYAYVADPHGSVIEI